MTVTITNQDVHELQQEWVKAKKAEDSWKAFRLAKEEEILQALNDTGYDFPFKGKLSLEHLDIDFGLTRKFSQACLGQVVASNPSLLQSTFKVEYKPVRNALVDELVNSGSAVGIQLASCFEDKPRKPAFKAHKEE
ncbi:MAG TPA: hypothetical protein ENJ30_12560 [Desulfobulbaceae bacterium]|nr:hypothetical protein [Desulfobulbaceae bacterium]